MKERNRVIIILAIFILITICLHLPIIFYGMPYSLGNVDENDFIGTALNYGASKSIKPLVTWYPAFYSYLLTSALGIYFGFLFVFSKISSVNDFAVHYLLYPGYFHLVGRLLSSIFSSLSIVFIYLCGKNYKNRHAGIFAAFFLTFSNLLFRKTVWALPSSAFILLSTISLYFILKYYNKNRISYLIWSGLFCGLGISTKYNVGIIMLIGFTAILFKNEDSDEKLFLWKRINSFILTSPLYYYLLFVVIGFLLGSPYWLLDVKANINGLLWEIGRLNVEKTTSNIWLSNLPYIWIFSELIINERIVGIIYILSVFLLLYYSLKKDRSAILFLPFIVISFILIGKYQKHSLHYLFPAFPVLFIIAGNSFYDFIANKNKVINLVFMSFIIVGVLIPIDNVITYSLSHLNKDARLLASDWIQKNIPVGATIAIGKTSNAPPLPDSKRFEKDYYSSISEQMISKELPENIKQLYAKRINGTSYNLINYIVKRSSGRTKSFSDMLSDIVIIPYDEIKKYHPQYLIFSSLDDLYFTKQGFKEIINIPDYENNLDLIKTFQSTNRSYYIKIYKIKANRV